MIPAFDSVLCDWLGGSHRYPEPVKPIESGKILRVDKDGQADRLMVLKGVLAELFDDEGGEK